MFIKKISIHNFRSIQDAEFELDKYSLLIGENNAGKTNILTALRIFYEDDIKFDQKTDFPKCCPKDNESWIEIDYFTTDNEQKTLKDEYKSSDNILRVRRYLKSDNPELVKNGQSNIYAYESGSLSKNLFYGAKNISQAKLGKLLYIPEICKTDESFKMSGPSPLRNMIDFVMQKVIKNSPTYSGLKSAFEKFNSDFKEESSNDGFSLKELTKDINSYVEDWDVVFGLDINTITADSIIKNLVSHYIEDKQLNNQRIPINCYGQGLQRHLIFTLIRVGANYIEKKEEKKKEFSPEFTLILFEEPEAFLHPTQQEILNNDLEKIADGLTQQIMISSHSPVFVSRNIKNLPSIIKTIKTGGITQVFQIVRDTLDSLFDENASMFKMFSCILADPKIDQSIKDAIKKRRLGDEDSDPDKKLEEESIRYFLWLDSERACSFFAKHVFICEGASEKIFLDHLLNTEWTDLKSKHIYILDSMGKYNLHRYMNIFGELGVFHSVIYDKDQDKSLEKATNDFINGKKNKYTKGIYSFENDFEGFLGIKSGNSRRDLKPLNVILNYSNKKIDVTKISDLRKIVEGLL